MSVLLHIGLEKTGTKSIQYWLRDHESLLVQRGIRFPRGWLRLNCHQELPLTLMRLDRLCSPRELGNDWRDAAWRHDVNQQIADDLAAHPNELTILSSENLDLLRYDVEFTRLRELVGDAEIVVYLRDKEQWLTSLRQQYLHKNAPGRTLSTDDDDAYNYLEPDTWRADFDALLERWATHFTSVRVADYDKENERDGSIVPSFLRHLGLPLVDANYRLNTWGEPTPRADGNRSLGLRFGQDPASQTSGSLSVNSMPSN